MTTKKSTTTETSASASEGETIKTVNLNKEAARLIQEVLNLMGGHRLQYQLPPEWYAGVLAVCHASLELGGEMEKLGNGPRAVRPHKHEESEGDDEEIIKVPGAPAEPEPKPSNIHVPYIR